MSPSRGRKRRKPPAPAPNDEANIPLRSSSLSSSLPWPAEYTKSSGARFPPDNLLHNLEPRLWSALAHVPPAPFHTDPTTKKEGKTLALQPALELLDVSWIGMNNYKSRCVVSSLYKLVHEFYARNEWRAPVASLLPAITPVTVRDVEYCGSNFKFELLSSDDSGEINSSKIPTKDEAIQIKHNVDTFGMDVLRGAVNQSTIDKLLQSHNTSTTNELLHTIIEPLREMDDKSKKKTLLRTTNGSGTEGDRTFTRKLAKGVDPCGSYYCYLQHSDYLQQLQRAIVRLLLSSSSQDSKQDNTVDEAIQEVNKRSYILLRYSKGGENYAHTDAIHKETVFPYQALLMLSNSCEYDGGEFYVAKQDTRFSCTSSVSSGNNSEDCDISITRRYVSKLNAGDLVIFRSNGGYNHGMKVVTRGERVAVGLLQAVEE
eukprot:scaffold55810_cov49-Cyclotella_meneghiniana.AAC.5